MLGWILLLIASSVSQQVATKPKYKVVKVGEPDQTITALNASADQGYRLLLSGRMLILRLESTPPDTYRYMAMNSNGGPVHFLNWLNDQGAHGYRWVPGVGVMEKEPHPNNYEYATAGHSFWGPTTKSPTLSGLVSQGYHPLGFGPPSRSRWSPEEMFFERELGLKPKPMHVTEGGEIEIADAMRAGNVLKQVDALAEKGYRYVGPSDPQKGGAVLMEKCGQECEVPFEYRYFDVHNMAQLVTELNEQGKDGFRVLSRALTSRPHLLERAGARKETYAYHVLQGKDPAALEQALNAPQQEGYTPLGYVWRDGWTAAEAFLLLEKTSTVLADR